MSSRVTVDEGDCFANIALEAGFVVDTLWLHDVNRKLREERENPHLLVPGDKVNIPDIEKKHCEGASEQKHRFVRKGVPEKLRLQLLFFNEPRSNLEYRLDVGTEIIEGVTDSDGFLQAAVSPALESAMLHIGEHEQYEIMLRNLRPSDSEKDEGARQRLFNLGFIEDLEPDEDALRSGVILFQGTREELDPTGELDQDTLDSLVEAHGS